MEYNKKQLEQFSLFLNSISNHKTQTEVVHPSGVISYNKKGNKIHIKKENRGKFTESAKMAGMGVLEYASHVLANKDKYSSTLVKRANFARNAKSFKHVSRHQLGGLIKLLENIKWDNINCL